MFGLGVWEFLLLAAVALVVLGPEQLPKLARQLGRGLRELRRAASEVQRNFEDAADEVSLKKDDIFSKNDLLRVLPPEGGVPRNESSAPPAAAPNSEPEALPETTPDAAAKPPAEPESDHDGISSKS